MKNLFVITDPRLERISNYFTGELVSLIQADRYIFYDTTDNLEEKIVDQILSGFDRIDGCKLYFYINSSVFTNFSKLNRMLTSRLFGFREITFFFITSNYIQPTHLQMPFNWIVLNLSEDNSGTITSMNLILTLIKTIDLPNITLSNFFEEFITELRGSFVYKYPILHVSDNKLFKQKVFY
jgi:hypothetical protein